MSDENKDLLDGGATASSEVEDPSVDGLTVEQRAAARREKMNAAYKDKNVAGKPNSKLRTIVAAGVSVAVIVAAGTAIYMGMNQGDTAQNKTDSSSSVTPAKASGSDGGYVVNADVVAGKNPVTLDVYEDFQCPFCKQVEDSLGKDMRKLADEGKIKLVYHLKTFLDDNLQNDSSSKSANATLCAGDYGMFQPYHDEVYKNQPVEEGDGYSDQQIQQFAVTVGLNGANLEGWKKCVADKKYSNYLAKVEDRSARDKVLGTPELRLNGKKIDMEKFGSMSLEQMVDDAAAGKDSFAEDSATKAAN